jgi:mercuric ion transport protein
MNDRKLLRGGVIGSVIAAICCFTPFLVVVFAALGISAWMGWWLDYFLLFPALAFFLGMTAYAIYRLKRNTGAVRGAGVEEKEAKV